MCWTNAEEILKRSKKLKRSLQRYEEKIDKSVQLIEYMTTDMKDIKK